MQDINEAQLAAKITDLGIATASNVDPFSESMDPNEIRFALGELRDLMSRIRSSAIRRDLRVAYERIASISVSETVIVSRAS